MDKLAVIIVAGGRGTRMGSDIPKQFLPLGREGKPILAHTLERFLHALPDTAIWIALPEDAIGMWNEICGTWGLLGTHKVCAGGSTRYDSVKNALKRIAGCDWVAIHDGARPLVSVNLIKDSFDAARLKGTAVPVTELSDSVRILTPTGSKVADRTAVRVVQTPQVFGLELLRRAYQLPYSTRYTDDASVVEETGEELTLIRGENTNIKITTARDLIIAEALLEAGY